MRKLLLSLALALPVLFFFCSCTSDEDDPILSGYLYTAVVQDISYDLMDFYDINITFMTTTGVQESYAIKESGQIPQRQIFWERNVREKGDFIVTMNLVPKTTAVMDDENDYMLSFEMTITAGTVDERDPAGRVYAVHDTQKGAFWKSKGEQTFSETVSPKI